MNKLVFLALGAALAACQQDNKNLERKIDAARQEARRRSTARGGVAAGAGAQPQARPQRQEPDRAKTYAVPVDNDAFDGPADAKVTVVKAYDYACPYCEKVRADDGASCARSTATTCASSPSSSSSTRSNAMAGALAFCAAEQAGQGQGDGRADLGQGLQGPPARQLRRAAGRGRWPAAEVLGHRRRAARSSSATRRSSASTSTSSRPT